MPSISHAKIEAGTAIVSAVLGMAGAILVEPVILVLGAIAAAAVTVLRVTDRDAKNKPAKPKAPEPRANIAV